MTSASPPPSFAGPIDYSRTEKSDFARNRVAHLKAIVVGAGALGNEVVKALGLLGAGRIVVIDPDTVEPNNLTRSVFFRSPEAAGLNKAKALAESAATFFPDTRIEGWDREIADVGFGFLVDADLLFGCVDNELARLEMAYISTKLDLPVCDGGLGGPSAARGRVTWFAGREGGCYSCRLRPQKRRELLTLWEAASHPCWVEDAEAEVRPSTPTMAAVTGSMQVEMALRRWLAAPDQAAESISVEIRLDRGDLPGAPKVETIRIPRSPKCPFHSEPEVLLPEPAKSLLRVSDLMEAASGMGSASQGRAVVLLDWPICIEARCQDCDGVWRPMRRLGVLRRQARCPRCGSPHLSGLKTLHKIEQDSPWQAWRVAELGLPEKHLHTVRYEGRASE